MLFELTYKFIRPGEVEVTTFTETRDTLELAQNRFDHTRWVMARRGYKYLGGWFRRIQ